MKVDFNFISSHLFISCRVISREINTSKSPHNTTLRHRKKAVLLYSVLLFVYIHSFTTDDNGGDDTPGRPIQTIAQPGSARCLPRVQTGQRGKLQNWPPEQKTLKLKGAVKFGITLTILIIQISIYGLQKEQE